MKMYRQYAIAIIIMIVMVRHVIETFVRLSVFLEVLDLSLRS
jgi:hypothetical protein